MRRHSAVGSKVFPGLLVSLLCVLPACNSPRSTTSAASAEAPTRVGGVPVWQAGHRFVYTTALSSKLLLGGQGMMGVALTAKLALQARRASTETQFLAQLSELHFKSDSPDAQAKFDGLALELAAPFGFTLTEGKLKSLRLPGAWSPFASTISRTIAAAFQLVPAKSDPDGKSWTANESDVTGSYDAEYSFAPGSTTTLSKHKLRYAKIDLGKTGLTQTTASLAPEVVASKWTLELGSGAPAISSVTYQEGLKLPMTPTSFVDSQTELSLKLSGTEPPKTESEWSALVANTKQLAPNEMPSPSTASVNYDANRIGDYTFDQAVRELEEQAKDPKRNQLLESVRGEPYAPEQAKERENKLAQQQRAFTALAALLRRDKQDIPLAVARIHAASPALRALIDALSSAGTPEAQAALVTLMNDASLPDSVRPAAAFSLTRTEHATAESIAALQAHIADGSPLHVVALYGLGTIARRVRDAGDTKTADAIAQGLLAALSKATQPADQVDALRAIANSGATSAFDAVQPFLSNKVIKVRVAAIDAMRLMQRPEVDGIIILALKDPEVDLQDAALDALSVRTATPAVVSAVSQASESGTKPGIRLKAVKIMGKWLPEHPEVRASLQKATHDQAPQVSKAATLALGG